MNLETDNKTIVQKDKVLSDEAQNTILQTIHLGQENLLKLRREGGFWKFPAYLGPFFVCQYFLACEWMNIKDSGIDKDYLKELLLSRQLSDGGWVQLKDANFIEGELNVSIITYWTLKVLGVAPHSEPMKRARTFIHNKGGLDNAEIFTIVLLALFRIVSWDQVPATPYITFMDFVPMNYKRFSQWSRPHMMPFAYMQSLRMSKDLGSAFSLDELKPNPQPVPNESKKPNKFFDGWLINKIVRLQNPVGCWGGYTTSTVFSLLAMSHFSENSSRHKAKIENAVSLGLSFLKTLYLNPSNGAYTGITCDGTNWDTILTSTALLETGFTASELSDSLDFIVNEQAPNGGMPFGMGFINEPDVDDTCSATDLWFKVGGRYRENALRSLRWLMERQNDDGGWGAFNQNNRNNFLLNFFLRNYKDRESLFDYSSNDCAGHVLEAMAFGGYNKYNSPIAQKAILYLKKNQADFGGWKGRWAQNYLFGTSVAVQGLLASGEDARSPYIQRAIRWMTSKQNSDGGFGETPASYVKAHLAGCGESTPSHTAWVLITLVECGLANTEVAQRAAKWLTENFKKRGRWVDQSVTATGHPGLTTMQYSLYAPTFPLIALGKYLKALGIQVSHTKLDWKALPAYNGFPPIVGRDVQL
ncbi:MAG: prenyltransferase/squalene oxidase repeat-containing protein [Pseudomonadota bacterium]|nr:prenyltransferase/squalene oxidase repeat-containing protein [Pseudomonadota bacterium]